MGDNTHEEKLHGGQEPVTEGAKGVENPEVEEVPAEEAPAKEPSETERLTQEVTDLKEQLEKEKKEYLFLAAEFDNFRKRTLREKSEIIRNGAESAMKGLLPVVDDFERAIKASEDTDNAESLKEGTRLIYNKFVKYLEQNGVKEIETLPGESDFDTEKHEAISVIPAPAPELKNKVIDTVQKGYTLNDKVLRHAKVVVGQ